MRDLLLIHHAAQRQHLHPPSSLAALCACIAERACVVPVDVTPLADGAFALLHDSELARVTDGAGPTAAATGDQVRRLRYRIGDTPFDEPVASLSQAVEIVRRADRPCELQLDLKPHAPLGDAVLRALVARIQPLSGRVRVTSTADWALRRLAALAPSLAAALAAQAPHDDDPHHRRIAY